MATKANSQPIELVVMSRPALQGLTPGHIMLAVSVPGGGEQAWGFYPDGIKDEIRTGGWHRYTSSVVIPISAAQHRQLLQSIASYRRTHDYKLLSTNCRHFVVSMLLSLGIQVGQHQLWPNDQGKLLMKQHGERWGSCLR